MFGIIYGLGMLFSDIGARIQRGSANHAYKQYWTERRARGENWRNVYYDWQGRERDLDTNKKVMFYTDSKTGHYMEKEVGGPVLRDFTQEEYEERINYHARNNTGVVAVGEANPRQLMVMWSRKYYNKIAHYMEKKQPPFDTAPYIFRHCVTRRLCFTYYPYGFDGKKDEVNKAWDRILYEYMGKEHIKGPGCVLVDLFSGEIIEISDCHGRRKEPCIYSYDFEKNKATGRINEFNQEYLTMEEEDELVEIYNQEMREGKAPKITTEWAALFK